MFVCTQIDNMSAQQPDRFPPPRLRQLSFKTTNARCTFCEGQGRVCYRVLMRNRVRSWYDELGATMATDEQVYESLRQRVMDAGPNFFAPGYGLGPVWPNRRLPHCVERLLRYYAPNGNPRAHQGVAVAAAANVVPQAAAGADPPNPPADNDGDTDSQDGEGLSTRSSNSS